MIQRLFGRLTGQPWTTVRNCTTEFGPPPGAVHRAKLERYTEAQLYAYNDQIVAVLREQRRHRARPCTAA